MRAAHHETVRPVDAETFAAALDPFGPFEPEPVLAVAVSGGSDSMALALLADSWARKRGGHIVALTVDHRLRPESTAEVRAVGRWMAEHGITHVPLSWQHEDGDPDHSDIQANIQARARAARYRLMSDWCIAHGVLHVLLAHHRDDQAETLLLRLGRGSGVDGLAAMAPVVENYGVRLLRPLLAIPRSRLAQTLRRVDQHWIEDPSNRNPRYARVRLRALAPALAEEGMTTERLASTASRLRRARESLERMTADFLIRAASPFDEGFVRLDREELRNMSEEIALRALARIVTAVGGLNYVPRRERSEGLLKAALRPTVLPRRGTNDTVLATLGGVMMVAEKDDTLLFIREPAAVAPPVTVTGPGNIVWDNRFRIHVRGARSAFGRRVLVGALGEAGARNVLKDEKSEFAHALGSLPRRVRPTLPALLDDHGRVIAAADFIYGGSYGRAGAGADSLAAGIPKLEAVFAPSLPLVGPGFMAGFTLV
jgi:tRNA(Ile)-lysidine synthase